MSFQKVFALCVSVLVAGCATTPKPLPATADPVGAYADINGIRMYYEVHGKPGGTPIVLLNGGGSDIQVTFGRILPFLERNHFVIALDEQGHGRTSDRNAPVTFETSAEDVITLLKTLKIENADLFGFSNGASVALEVTIRHPELVRKLIFAASITKHSGAAPEFWAMFKKPDFNQMPQPLKDEFLKVNPDSAKLRTMFEKDAARMKNFKDVPDSRVKTVRAQTLILLGDRDVPTVQHGVELTHLIAGSRLIVLEGIHGEYIGEMITGQPGSRYPELTAGLLEEFLKSPVEKAH